MENGSGRLDRIERILERTAEQMQMMAERMDMMLEHHDREFKSLLRWQVIMQDRFDKTQDQFDKLAAQQQARDERIDKLVIAIGKLIEKREEKGTDKD